MPRPARHADEVARLHLDREDRALPRMDVEDAPPLDDEPHLVLVVPVLAAELREHAVEAGRRRLHVDHVRGDVPALRLQSLDLAAVGRQDVFRRRVGGHRV